EDDGVQKISLESQKRRHRAVVERAWQRRDEVDAAARATLDETPARHFDHDLERGPERGSADTRVGDALRIHLRIQESEPRFVFSPGLRSERDSGGRLLPESENVRLLHAHAQTGHADGAMAVLGAAYARTSAFH